MSNTWRVFNTPISSSRILSPEMVVLDVARLGFLMGDYRLFNETCQGDHWIFDFSNATLNHAMQFTPILMSKIYYHITVCYFFQESLFFIPVLSASVFFFSIFNSMSGYLIPSKWRKSFFRLIETGENVCAFISAFGLAKYHWQNTKLKSEANQNWK